MPDNLLTLVINLEGSTQRLESVGTDLDAAEITWQRLDAVDFRGRKPHEITNYDSAKCHIRHDGDLTGGEMGCVLSHLKALKTFLQGDADFVLVLEDDASVPKDAVAILDGLLTGLNDFAPNGWDAVFPALTSKGYDASRVFLCRSACLAHQFHTLWRACDHLVTRRRAILSGQSVRPNDRGPD